MPYMQINKRIKKIRQLSCWFFSCCFCCCCFNLGSTGKIQKCPEAFCVCCVSLSMVVAGSWCSLMTATPSTAGPKSCIKCTIRVSTIALLVCCPSFTVRQCSPKYCTKRHVVQGFLAIKESVVRCFKGKPVVLCFKGKSVVLF